MVYDEQRSPNTGPGRIPSRQAGRPAGEVTTALTNAPDSDTERPLATRYGQPSRGAGVGWKIALAVLVVAALAWVAWAALARSSHDQVGALVQSYQVESPHAMSVTVQITRTSTSAVQCTVSAIATDHSQVGETVVGLPAGASGTRTVTAVVKTERTATSANVGRCH